MPDFAHGFLVRPALLPRLAQAARGRFARLDSTLREIRFQGFTFTFSSADVPFRGGGMADFYKFFSQIESTNHPPAPIFERRPLVLAETAPRLIVSRHAGLY